MPLRVELPSDFDIYEWETKAKGYYEGRAVTPDGRQIQLAFYDPQRLAQEIEDALREEGRFVVKNLVVVSEVNRATIEDSTSHLDGLAQA